MSVERNMEASPQPAENPLDRFSKQQRGELRFLRTTLTSEASPEEADLTQDEIFTYRFAQALSSLDATKGLEGFSHRQCVGSGSERRATMRRHSGWRR
jgi:hypothetical protein